MTLFKNTQPRHLIRWRQPVLIFLLIIGWFWIGWFARDVLRPVEGPEVALVRQAGYAMAKQYYGPLPTPRQMTYAAIRGLLSSLGDKYSAFYEPPVAAHDHERMLGNNAVIGVRGEMQSGAFVITEVFAGEPADRAGVQAGDVVLEIDGWQVKPSAAYMEVMTMIRGPVGSTARLTVRRGEGTLSFDVPRKTAPEVSARMIEDNLAYMRFDAVTEKTPQAVEQSLKELMAARPAGLVLDLRYNGGGLMEPTRQILDLFLDEGIAFYAKGKDGRLLPFKTATGGPAETIPLVVLIGPNTYSAPEAMAASIADRKRGSLIGETTYGKGAIKNTIRLRDGASIQLTVGQWLSPVRRELYEGRGVPPDVVVRPEMASSSDIVLSSAVEYLRRRQ